MGEAEKPGPPAHFDSEDDDPWSNSEDQPQSEQDCEEVLPPTEHEIALSSKCGAQPGCSIDPPPVLTATQEWIKNHANKSFVPVLSKRVTKASKFEGAKPGWVFQNLRKWAWLLQRQRQPKVAVIP